MDGGKIVSWIEAHPAQSIIIGAGGLVLILWLFGAFGRKQQSDGGAASMAAAYYAAEAQQAVIGGQIQAATIQATRDTAIAALETDAAGKIEQTRANAAITINGQNADASTKLGEQNLLATYSNNATTVAVTNSNNEAATRIAANNNWASILSGYINSILPSELSTYGSSAWSTYIPGLGTVTSGASGTPAQLRAAGYSESQIAAAYGY